MVFLRILPNPMNWGGRGAGWEGGFEPPQTRLYTEAWGGVCVPVFDSGHSTIHGVTPLTVVLGIPGSLTVVCGVRHERF